MSAAETHDLESRLAQRLDGLPGIERLFPERAVAAALSAIAGPVRVTPRVSVEDGVLLVSLRVAVERAVPTAVVLAEVEAAVGEQLGGRDFRLEIEVAQVTRRR